MKIGRLLQRGLLMAHGALHEVGLRGTEANVDRHLPLAVDIVKPIKTNVRMAQYLELSQMKNFLYFCNNIMLIVVQFYLPLS